jgi:hypothetical protein
VLNPNSKPVVNYDFLEAACGGPTISGNLPSYIFMTINDLSTFKQLAIKWQLACK